MNRYCESRISTRYITARTIIREKKLKRLALKSYSNNSTKGSK